MDRHAAAPVCAVHRGNAPTQWVQPATRNGARRGVVPRMAHQESVRCRSEKPKASPHRSHTRWPRPSEMRRRKKRPPNPRANPSPRRCGQSYGVCGTGAIRSNRFPYSCPVMDTASIPLRWRNDSGRATQDRTSRRTTMRPPQLHRPPKRTPTASPAMNLRQKPMRANSACHPQGGMRHEQAR